MEYLERVIEECVQETSPSDWAAQLGEEDKSLLKDVLKASKAIRSILGSLEMELRGKHHRFVEIDYSSPRGAMEAEALKGEIRGMKRIIDLLKEATEDGSGRSTEQPAANARDEYGIVSAFDPDPGTF